MYHLPLYYVQLRCLNIYRSKKQNGGEFPRLFFWLDLDLGNGTGILLPVSYGKRHDRLWRLSIKG